MFLSLSSVVLSVCVLCPSVFHFGPLKLIYDVCLWNESENAFGATALNARRTLNFFWGI